MRTFCWWARKVWREGLGWGSGTKVLEVLQHRVAAGAGFGFTRTLNISEQGFKIPILVGMGNLGAIWFYNVSTLSSAAGQMRDRYLRWPYPSRFDGKMAVENSNHKPVGLELGKKGRPSNMPGSHYRAFF